MAGKSSKADRCGRPAKWYGGQHAKLLPADSRLVTNQHSYVMRIRHADFEDMLRQRFNFTKPLQRGHAFYSANS